MAELNQPESKNHMDPYRPNLCTSLRWKGLFTESVKDETVNTSANYFWCLHSQTCLGPDGQLAEPGFCDKPDRSCHKQTMPLA